MKGSVFIISFLLFAVVSCKKENQSKLEGNYKGTFMRNAVAIDFRPTNVTLALDEKTYTGNSDVPKYPAICSGKWNANEKTIRFTNGCAWTADFDHTLILDGEFKYEWNGNKLTLRKTTGQFTDVYQLEKQ